MQFGSNFILWEEKKKVDEITKKWNKNNRLINDYEYEVNNKKSTTNRYPYDNWLLVSNKK